MLRKIIEIDQELCNGCGICVDACHEGALAMVDGKAQLMRDDYCDGLGDCLPNCPVNAISFTVREALAYDHEAVQKNIAKKNAEAGLLQDAIQAPVFSGCPGSMAKSIRREATPVTEVQTPTGTPSVSQLTNWPVQIKLLPVQAPYLNGAHLLIAADCTAFSYANFHEEFMKNKVSIIGCPKLDEGDYSEKLTAILANNAIKSVTVARMEVPCCTGLANAAIQALKDCGKMIPWNVVTISTDGRILEA